MVRNLCPTIQILSEFQSADISKNVVVWVCCSSLATLDSICAKLKLEIEPDWKARRVQLHCSACWVASSLGNVKKANCIIFPFPWPGPKNAGKFAKSRKKKLSSAIASGVQDTCLSHQRESNQTDILFSINQVSKARQSTSFDINAVVTVVELMHSFLMEYHKSRFNAAKIMAAVLTGEVSSLPAFPWA